MRRIDILVRRPMGLQHAVGWVLTPYGSWGYRHCWYCEFRFAYVDPLSAYIMYWVLEGDSLTSTWYIAYYLISRWLRQFVDNCTDVLEIDLRMKVSLLSGLSLLSWCFSSCVVWTKSSGTLIVDCVGVLEPGSAGNLGACVDYTRFALLFCFCWRRLKKTFACFQWSAHSSKNLTD